MQYYQLPLISCSAKVNSFSIVVAKNYERKMLSSSFNYVVLAVGKTLGGRKELCFTKMRLYMSPAIRSILLLRRTMEERWPRADGIL